MRRKIILWLITSVLLTTSFGLLGAGPQQGGVPPQPFFADYFSGQVTVQGAVPPPGTQLVACIDDCRTGFESKPVLMSSGGAFSLLEVNPPERFLRGRQITFYLVNQHGRIKATETANFEGAYAINKLNLSFDQPLPRPLPPPALPRVGDPVVASLPKLALGTGSAAIAIGALLILLGRRRYVTGRG